MFVVALAHFFTAHALARTVHAKSPEDSLFLLMPMAVVSLDVSSLHSDVPTALQAPSVFDVQALVSKSSITPVELRHLVFTARQSAEFASVHPFNVFAYAIETPVEVFLQFVALVTLTQTALAEEVHACLPAVSRYPTVAFLHLALLPDADAVVHSASAFDAHPVVRLPNAFAV